MTLCKASVNLRRRPPLFGMLSVAAPSLRDRQKKIYYDKRGIIVIDVIFPFTAGRELATGG